jgi:hypothetical protein
MRTGEDMYNIHIHLAFIVQEYLTQYLYRGSKAHIFILTKTYFSHSFLAL